MVKFKRIGLFVGHSKLKDGKYTSSNSVKNEYLYNKELGTELKKVFDEVGQPCDLIICPEGKFASAKEESNYKLPIANSGKYDLVVELHLNCFNGSAKGAEVLYLSNSGKVVAERVQKKLKTKFADRGLKKRDNLYMLTKTNPVSIMLETFFTDNAEDCKIADSLGVNGVAKLIAEGILDTEIKKTETTKTETKQPETTKCPYIVRVICDELNIREGVGTSYKVVGTLKRGDAYTVVEEKDGWGLLKSYQSTRKGWISLNQKYVQKV